MSNPTPIMAWKTARAALGQSTTSQATSLVKFDGTWDSNTRKVSEIFADYFLGKTSGLRPTRKMTPTIHSEERLCQHLERSFPTGPPPFQLREITQQDLARLLKRYHGGRALPGDRVEAHIHNVAATVTLPALVKIVNHDIRESKFGHR